MKIARRFCLVGSFILFTFAVFLPKASGKDSLTVEAFPLDKGLQGVIQLLEQGKVADAVIALDLLATLYPDNELVEELTNRLHAEIRRALPAPSMQAVPLPVFLADQSAADHIAVMLIQHAIAELNQTDPAQVAVTAASLLKELDPVLERIPALYEAVYLQAQLSVLAEDEIRGRAAARILAAWGIRQAVLEQPAVIPLVIMLHQRSWFDPPENP
jgi:hypothetical protein